MTSGAEWHAAQVNIALPLEPLTSARLADFVAQLEPVNALADNAPGFVWRLKTEDDDATAIRGFGDDRLIINMSVWTSVPPLADFVYGPAHRAVLQRRREWFAPVREAYSALWWVPADTEPTVADAEKRVASLRRIGPTPYAFTLRRRFDPDGRARLTEPDPARTCPA
jgi:hypothetical protein